MLSIPIISGIPEDKTKLGLLTYAVCEDGVYLIKKAGFGYVTLKLEKVPGVSAGREEIATLIRKIPLDAYYKSLNFFRYIEKNVANGKALEVFTLVLYSKAEDKYILYVPKQLVGPGSVKYDIREVKSMFPGYIIALDIHSHTSAMGAFFSSTDDGDDNRDRYSMVIGNINRIFPTHVLRFCTMNRKIDFTIDDIFEDGVEIGDFNIEESAKRVISVENRNTADCCAITTKGWSVGNSYGRYEILKDKLLCGSKKEFSITELMGEDW